MAEFNILTVTQITSYLKSYIDENRKLFGLYVRGEITNFKGNYCSGHLYFTIKDASSEISCVMFKSYAERLRFSLKDGMAIIVRCDLSVYQKTGSCQLYVYDIQPEGIGANFLAIEELKEKLSKEGLFDIEHKKAIPRFPETIGVITSAQGAAIHDIENVLNRRWPLAKIILTPALVQGETAANQLTEAVKIQDSEVRPDVIIIGRGGGSAEDLFAFNDETLARAIYKCETPIVSAVGHEVDYSICDFVADLRAPTPSAAAEIIAPDCKELSQTLDYNLQELYKKASEKYQYYNDKIAHYSVMLNSFTDKIINDYSRKCAELEKELLQNEKKFILKSEEKLSYEIFKLDKNNPAAIMKKQICIAEKDGKTIGSIDDISVGDRVRLCFKDGNALANITEKELGGIEYEKES